MNMKEPQYNYLIELEKKKGLNNLGLMLSADWSEDPKRLLFVLSRYKFVAKMLDEKQDVLEVGCGDAWASRIVKQTVKNLTVSDFDPLFIDDAKSRNDNDWPLTYLAHDMIKKPTEKKYDAIYLMDVFEHINPKNEGKFLSNICKSLNQSGVVIIGTPSSESQAFASPQSIEGHVNCKTGEDFKALMAKYFEHVFLFSMNDEMIHTGFSKMANYLITLCCNQINHD